MQTAETCSSIELKNPYILDLYGCVYRLIKHFNFKNAYLFVNSVILISFFPLYF